MEHIFSLWSLLKTPSTSIGASWSIRKQHSRHLSTSGFVFPAVPTSHISPDWKAKLPGFPSRPPPPLLLFLLVSPDLSASVSQPSLCLTDGLSRSRQSLRRLSAAVISSRQGHPLQHSRHAANEERPHVSWNRGSMRGIFLLIKEPPFSCLISIAISGCKVNFNSQNEVWPWIWSISALIRCNPLCPLNCNSHLKHNIWNKTFLNTSCLPKVKKVESRYIFRADFLRLKRKFQFQHIYDSSYCHKLINTTVGKVKLRKAKP